MILIVLLGILCCRFRSFCRVFLSRINEYRLAWSMRSIFCSFGVSILGSFIGIGMFPINFIRVVTRVNDHEE